MDSSEVWLKEVDLKHLFKTPDSRMELAAHVARIIGYFLVDTKASFYITSC